MMRARSLPVGYVVDVYFDYDVGIIARRWSWETVHYNPHFLGFGRAYTKSGARRAAHRAAVDNNRRNP
jgi:hypothetical protein